MKKSLIKYFYYPLSQRLKKHKVSEYLMQLKINDFRPLEELREIQDKLLGETLKIASNTPYYVKIIRDCGIDINDLSDFSKFPFTVKGDISHNPQDFHNPAYSGDFVEGRTSGSTGVALPIRYDNVWDQWNQAAQWRGRSWWDVVPGTRELNIWGRAFDNPKAEWKERFKLWLMNRKLISSFKLTDKHLDEIIGELIKFNPEVIYSYTTGVGRFAEYLCDKYGDKSPIRPRTVLITSEALFEQHRHAINKAFRLEPGNEYGAAESGLIAFQCPEGGLHHYIDRVKLEIVDENKDGFGRVIVTSLLNQAMPIIRYELGDLGRFSDKTCPCGRTLPLIELAGTRVSEMIVTKNGTSASSTFFDFMAKSLIPHGLRQFRVIQKAIDLFHIQLVHKSQGDEKIEKMIREQVNKYIGDDMRIEFEYLDAMYPDKSGKLRYFVREEF